MYSRGGTEVICTSDDTHNAILVCSNAVEEVKLATDGGNSCADNFVREKVSRQASSAIQSTIIKLLPTKAKPAMARRQKSGCIRYQLVATDRRAAIRQAAHVQASSQTLTYYKPLAGLHDAVLSDSGGTSYG
jgi:hypothetical protein